MEHVIRLSKLTKRYGKKKVVDKVDLTVEKGHIYGLIGPNGAGKTTIMKMLAGTCLPTSGSMELFGSSKNLEKNRQRTSFMIEKPFLDGSFTAKENMEYIRRLRGVKDRAKIAEYLELAGLGDVGNKTATHFSLGMKQRLGIAMGLLPEPEIMVLDEPINGLDPEGIVDVRHLLLRLKEEKGITILISSHILSELSELCTDFAFINHGQLTECLSREELMQKCKSYLTVLTDQPTDKLAALLEKKMHLKQYEVQENGELHIFEKEDELAKISRTITDSGMTILKFCVEEESLEDYYMSQLNSDAPTEKSGGLFAKKRGKAGEQE